MIGAVLRVSGSCPVIRELIMITVMEANLSKLLLSLQSMFAVISYEIMPRQMNSNINFDKNSSSLIIII